MLETRAIVLSVKGGEAEISPVGGGCGQCEREGGCGSGKLSKMFCSSEPRSFLVSNQAGARVGDEVNIALPAGSLLRSVSRMYLLPLVLMLVGGGIGTSMAIDLVTRDGLALTGASLGLLSGFALGKYLPMLQESKAVVLSIVSPRL